MKFFIYSKGADGVAMAIRLKEEGNDVQIFVDDEYSRSCGMGLVDHAPSVVGALSKRPDVVVFDMTGFGAEADRIRKQGFKVIGGSMLADRLEHDRSFAMKLCERVGIRMPEYTEFKRGQLSQAMDFVAKTKKRYVLKPDDDPSGVNTALTYVAHSPDDMIQYLEWADKKRALKVDFMLQEFIPGLEISTEVWFSNGVPINPPNGTIELKKLMVGNVGPNTGCMASVVWPYSRREPRIVQQTTKKLYPALQAAKFTGPLDINAIIGKEDGRAYFLEFSPRFGYSAIYALAELFEEDFGKVLHDAVTGAADMKLKREFGMTVRLAIPPYPLEASKEHAKVFAETAGRRIRKLPDKHSWLLDVRMEEGTLVSAGTDGVICEVGYSGKDLETLQSKIYEMINHVEISDVQYRTDGAQRALEELPRLAEMGYEVPSVRRSEDGTDILGVGKAQSSGNGAIGKAVPVRSEA